MYKFIYPTKDSYIYELNTNKEKNFGGDDSLILKKDIEGDLNVNAVSRIILQFDLSEISKSVSSGNITNPNYYLRLYQKRSFELAPTYQLNAYALSQSWEEGTGYTEQNPNQSDGVSWLRGNEYFDNTNWHVGGIDSVEIGLDSASKSIDSLHLHLDTGSRSPGGGIWYDEGGIDIPGGDIAGISSQSFSYQSADIEMNVNNIVNKWLDGTRNNHGVILKWSGSQEDSENYSGDIEYFSIDSDSVYSPTIEVRWDNHLPCTGSNTGSLTQLTIDGTEDNYLYMINLRDTYRETEIPKFRVGSRKRYQTKSTSTSKSTTSTLFIPEGSGSYSIIDIITGKTIIPFGSNSLLSCDSKSNYFKQDLKSFIANRKYRITLRLQTNDNRKLIFDQDFDFKVVK